MTLTLPGAITGPRPVTTRPHRRPRSAPWWFLAALAVYVVAGTVLVLGHDGVMEDALARVSAASSVWSSSDPKLVAIGFVWTPLPALLMVVFTPLRALWPGLVSTGYLAALLSAVAMAAAVATTWGLLGDLRVRPAPRVATTLLFALSPIVVLYAGNGMTEALLIALLLAAARRLLRWVQAGRAGGVPDLVVAGLFLGLGYLARYEALVAAAAVTVLVMVVTATRERTRRGAAVVADALLAGGPAALAFGIWALVSWLVVGSPFEQFSSAYGNSSLLTAAATGVPSLTTPAEQLFWLAPGLVPVLLAALVIRARPAAVPIAVFGSVLAFEWATYLAGSLFGFLRYQITGVPMVVVLLGVLLCGSRPGWWRSLGATALVVVVLGAGIVTSAVAMTTQPIGATQEYHRVRPLVTGDPTDSALGMWASDRAVAARLDAMDLPPASILVDAGSGFAVVAASAHPERFLITSDDGFAAVLADPPAHGIRVILRNDAGGVDAVRTTWASFGTPAAPSWVRPLGTVAPATPFSYRWSLWQVT